MTAYRALFSRGALQAGETVVILGAGSGVSTIAIALAAMAGARVLVTSSSPAKLDRARELGAAGGVLYTDPDWTEQLEPADLVVDSVGSTWPDSLSLLKPGGRVVAFGATGGDQAPRSACGRSTSASSRCWARRWAARATSPGCSS